MLNLAVDHFPNSRDLIRAHWAPLLLRPILGSPEQLVIGVAAVGQNSFHVEAANSFDRLRCFYSDAADTAIVAAEVAIEALRHDLSESAITALTDFKPVFSGIALGAIREAQGRSLQAIAASWLASLSSLYEPAATAPIMLQQSATTIDAVEAARPKDRLPELVLEYIVRQRPGLEDAFSEEIRGRAQRRRSTVAGLIIDFSGSKMVANLGTLSPANFATSFDRLKRRLWDLEIGRDQEKGTLAKRSHELIVQSPRRDDPQFSERQITRVESAIVSLEDEARRRDIRVVPKHTVPQIGDHILQREAA